MSYYAIFKPTEEAMKKYEPKVSNSLKRDDFSKLSMLIKILNDPEDSVDKFAFNLKLFLSFFKSKIEEQSKTIAYNNYKEDGTVWYCGRQYSKSDPKCTIESVYDYVIEKLTLLHYCVKSGDYFDENSKFWDKLNEIKEVLEYFEDACFEICNFEIMNDLKEFRVGDEDEISSDTINDN